MKKIFIVVFLTTTFLNAQSNRESFEGIITYKVKLTINSNELSKQSQQYLKLKFGDSLKAFHHHKGSILRKYFGSGSNGNEYQLYNSSNNMYYLKHKYSDTIYFHDVGTNLVELKNKYLIDDSEKILGQSCKSITYEGYANQDNQLTKVTFHYSGEPYVDSDFYKEWKDFFNSDFFAHAKSPYLKYTLETIYFTLEIVAVEIEEMKIEEKIFELPSDSIFLNIDK